MLLTGIAMSIRVVFLASLYTNISSGRFFATGWSVAHYDINITYTHRFPGQALVHMCKKADDLLQEESSWCEDFFPENHAFSWQMSQKIEFSFIEPEDGV